MKYIITSALGLFIIFSSNIMYCAEKNPTPKTSPRDRLAQLKVDDKNKTKVEEKRIQPGIVNRVTGVSFPPRKTTH